MRIRFANLSSVDVVDQRGLISRCPHTNQPCLIYVELETVPARFALELVQDNLQRRRVTAEEVGVICIFRNFPAKRLKHSLAVGELCPCLPPRALGVIENHG